MLAVGSFVAPLDRRVLVESCALSLSLSVFCAIVTAIYHRPLNPFQLSKVSEEREREQCLIAVLAHLMSLVPPQMIGVRASALISERASER